MRRLESFFHRTLKRPYKLAKTYDAGRGQPVILLHGIASSSLIWQPLYNLDSPGLRIVSFDLLGFGSSPKPDWSDYSIEDHAKSVVASIRKLKLRHPIVLVGHSMGSLIATHIALRNPKLVKKLILYEPPVFASETGHKRYERRKSTYLRAFGYIASRQELVLMYSQVLGQRLKGNTAFSMDRAGWLPFERSLRNTVIHQNTYDELLTIQTPTDIVYGRKDKLVIRVGANQLFASNPNISIHTIKEIHGLTPRSAKYLRDLINQQSYTKSN